MPEPSEHDAISLTERRPIAADNPLGGVTVARAQGENKFTFIIDCRNTQLEQALAASSLSGADIA